VDVDGSARHRVDPAHLGTLFEAVHRSRLEVDAARRGTSNTREIGLAQVRLLAVLEELESTLSDAGLPPPHALRHEVDLLRRLVGGGDGSVNRRW
jgi:hypothetical protein